jgi:ribosome biogenesis protein Nip4
MHIPIFDRVTVFLTLLFSENIMLRSVNISRENLVSLGTCFGKFNRAGKFKLHITALTYLYPYAKVFFVEYFLSFF